MESNQSKSKNQIPMFIIAGGKGEDTAEFSGNYSEYEITETDNKTIVTDTAPGRDGKDRLTDIEVLKFKNKIKGL